jgi:DNA-binding beta-propeller fold protein YncE
MGNIRRAVKPTCTIRGLPARAPTPLSPEPAVQRFNPRTCSLMLAALLIGGCHDSLTGPDLASRDYEVWLTDQSDSPGKAYGGTLYIYPKSQLLAGTGTTVGTPARVDLSGSVSAMCLASTGANPVRPHMIAFNSSGSHAIIAFVASGHVAILNTDTREPVACLRMEVGAGGGRQAHAAIPAPDDSYILVANQNGKLLQRINANFAANQFTLDAAATIDLTACTTPSGAACQSAALRPDNAPIVPVITSNSALAFVTLRGGGLFVVNPRVTPMTIRAEYDKSVIQGSGLTGVQVGSDMIVNSGLGFFAYRLPADVPASNAVNTPAPTTLVADASTSRDGHGVSATGDGKYVWITDRGTNVAEVFATATGARTTVSMTSALSSDPAPDLTDGSPAGDLLFVALRGPLPLSGGAVATGNTPGLGVVKLSAAGDRGTMQSVFRLTNLDASNVERADAHGIRVRIKPGMSAARVAALGISLIRRMALGKLVPETRATEMYVASRGVASGNVARSDAPQECDDGPLMAMGAHAEAPKR